MTIQLWVSVISAFLVIVGLLVTYFGPIGTLKEKVGGILGQLSGVPQSFENIFGRLGGIEQRLTAIETRLGNTNLAELAARLDIFWMAMEPSIKAIIKQPIHFRKDELIDRFPNLTNDELCELKDILKTEMHELTTNKDPKVLAYALMMARVDTVLYENSRKC
jgi:hypothetical protein